MVSVGSGLDDCGGLYLLNVVKEPATFADGRDDRCEVVVCEDHVGCLLADIASVETHGDADICTFQRWRVVDAVAGHHTVFASAVKSVQHTKFSSRAAASDNKRQRLEPIKLLVRHCVKIGRGHHG